MIQLMSMTNGVTNMRIVALPLLAVRA